jgi:hypothetical protein
MNRYVLIRRLRGPAILLLLGVVALLHEADLVDGWSIFFPLLLILIGVLKLAERAALAAAGDATMYPGSPYPYAAQTGVVQPQTATSTGTSIVPAGKQDYGNGPEGGQS